MATTPNIFTATAVGFAADGFSRLVTVTGIRKTEKINVWDDAWSKTTSEHNREFYFKCSSETETTLYLAFTIQHPEDTTDIELAKHICMRRIKRKETYMDLSSDYVIPAETCQAIVQSEATRIAAHIDGFLRKLAGQPLNKAKQDNKATVPVAPVEKKENTIDFGGLVDFDKKSKNSSKGVF